MQIILLEKVVNLGQLGLLGFGVVCSDGGEPAHDNSCDLVGFDALAAPDPVTLATSNSIVPNVVDFQIQYGVAPAGGQAVNDWVDATGATWENPVAADLARIKAVRMAIVTRGNREPGAVSPAQLVLWDAGLPTERTLALTDEQRRYRYRVLTVVVPLINLIWSEA